LSSKSGLIEMTVENSISQIDNYQTQIILYFAIIPIISFVFAVMHKETDKTNTIDYLLSVLIYAVSLPGILSVTLVFYSMFFVKINMLQVSLLVYFVPIVSMITTFVAISRKVSFGRLPGFGRLWSLMVLLAIIYFSILLLYRLRIHFVFLGSIKHLLIIGVVIFVAIKIVTNKLFKKSKE